MQEKVFLTQEEKKLNQSVERSEYVSVYSHVLALYYQNIARTTLHGSEKYTSD